MSFTGQTKKCPKRYGSFACVILWPDQTVAGRIGHGNRPDRLSSCVGAGGFRLHHHSTYCATSCAQWLWRRTSGAFTIWSRVTYPAAPNGDTRAIVQAPLAQLLHPAKPGQKHAYTLRLRGENPFISGKAKRRSSANRSITLAPSLVLLVRPGCRARFANTAAPVHDSRPGGALLGSVNAEFSARSASGGVACWRLGQANGFSLMVCCLLLGAVNHTQHSVFGGLHAGRCSWARRALCADCSRVFLFHWVYRVCPRCGECVHMLRIICGEKSSSIAQSTHTPRCARRLPGAATRPMPPVG